MSLVDQYDTALFDLDGVVYLGPEAVPAAPAALAALRARGTRVGFVTNNASRHSEVVAEHLRELGIEAEAGDVVSSAQAMAHLLAETLPPDSPVLVLGAPYLRDELVARARIRPVDRVTDHPVAVVQGLSPEMTWADLCEATAAIHAGATWYATNTDSTRPTDRGNLPGCGAAVGAIAVAVPVDPIVAGKPFPPLMRETLERLGGQRPLFVGDRVDTDIAGAHAVGIDSMLVLSGAHGPDDLWGCDAQHRPTHLGLDVADLLEPARTVEIDGDRARCGDQVLTRNADGYRWQGSVTDAASWCDAVWALCRLHWQVVDRGDRAPDPATAAIPARPVPQEVL